jgi:hypothetical protein
MVEIEIGVLRGQCLDRRIATQERLVSEIAAWYQIQSGQRDRFMSSNNDDENVHHAPATP